MSRRSARIQQQKDTTSAQTQFSLDEELVRSDSGEHETETPSTKAQGSQRKKRKTGKEKAISDAPGKKRRGTRGILNRLTEISLDVLYEIFGHLEPTDLLHLARTTKSLRKIVLNRSAIGVWKQALKSMAGLPACPKNISEPCYASLLFDHYCHACGAVTSSHKIQWVLRKRFCNKCIENEFISEEDALTHYEISEEVLWAIVPSLFRPGTRAWQRIRVFHEPTLQRYEIELKKKRTDKDKWVENTTKAYNKRTNHGNVCNKWLEKRLAARLDEGERIRILRRETIIQKLVDLGWGDEIENLNRLHRRELNNHSLVWQKRELTDRIWNNIRPELVQFLENAKAERIDYQEKNMLRIRRPLLKKLRDAYAKTVPPNSIIPTPADFNDYSPCRDIIDNTPPHQEVKLADFDNVLDDLPEFVAQWQKSKERELLEIMGAPVAADGEECDLTPLRLATTIFNCREDAYSHENCFMVTYPRILVHYGASLENTLTNNTPDAYDRELHRHLTETKWNYAGQLQFNTAAHDIAKDIVSLCGFDPLTATAEDMDNLDPLFVCNDCGKRGARRCMRWREAITHTLYIAAKIQPAVFPLHTFNLITDEELKVKIKLLLEQRKMARYHIGRSTRFGFSYVDRFQQFVCTHCRETKHYEWMKSHMKTHGVENATHADLVHCVDVEPQITCVCYFDELA